MKDVLHLVLLIKSDRLNRHELADFMGFYPMESNTTKEVPPAYIEKVKSKSWQFTTDFINSLDVNAHWDELKKKLPEPSALKALGQTCEIELFVRGAFYTMAPLIEFSNQTLSQASNYGFGLGYDITDHTE